MTKKQETLLIVGIPILIFLVCLFIAKIYHIQAAGVITRDNELHYYYESGQDDTSDVITDDSDFNGVWITKMYVEGLPSGSGSNEEITCVTEYGSHKIWIFFFPNDDKSFPNNQWHSEIPVFCNGWLQLNTTNFNDAGFHSTQLEIQWTNPSTSTDATVNTENNKLLTFGIGGIAFLGIIGAVDLTRRIYATK